MEIKTTKENNSLKVALKGRLDTNTAPGTEEKIKELLENVDALVLDMSELEYISSAGLRTLLSLKKALPPQATTTLTNLRDEILEVLEMTGFTQLFTIE